MDCSDAREALSALLDGEQLDRAEREAIDAHLAGCADCARWREHAHEVTRRFRVASAQSAPSPDESLLAAVHAAAPRGGHRNPVAIARVALVLIAIEQLVFTAQTEVFARHVGSTAHTAHEMASFDVALAVGFLVGAFRPARARGISVVVGAAALLLVTTAVIDIASGRTTPLGEMPHLLAVAGWLFLRQLTLAAPPNESPTGSAFSARFVLRSLSRSAPSYDAVEERTFSGTAAPTQPRVATAHADPATRESPDRQALAG